MHIDMPYPSQLTQNVHYAMLWGNWGHAIGARSRTFGIRMDLARAGNRKVK